ncbi:MAG: SCP2 sterol-binding domain-containing protein [Acidimicrobiia bacterium]
MTDFLTDDWFAQLNGDVPTGDGGLDTVAIEVTVLKAPGGDVTWTLEIGDGKVAARPGARPGADVTLTLPYDDAVRVLQGDVAPSVLFMRGTMKTAGDPGLLLDVLAATATSEFHTRVAAVAAATTV